MSEFADRCGAYKRLLALTSGRSGFYIGLVKWRNQLLALFCLSVFLAFGVLYFRYWVIQKPFGIILFIGEGLDAQTLAAARLHAGGADKPLAIDSLFHTALLKNYSADSAVPDPAAAATAIATGTKVKNGVVAVNAAGQPLPALLALARDAGRVTGLVTDGPLTAPTAASFYGHAQKKDEWENLARQLVESGEVDVVLGRGSADFLPQAQGGRRTDGKDLLSAAREAGYDYVQSLAALDEIPRWRRARLLGLFDEMEFGTPDDAKDSQEKPTLADMVRRGIELLQFHRGGYLLVVDATSMRRAGQQGLVEQRLAAAVALDRAISVAAEYTGDKSVIFVCGDVADGEISKVAGADKNRPRIEISPNAWVPTNERNDAPAEFSVVPLSEGDSLSRAASPSREASPPPRSEQTEVSEDILAFGKGLGADALHGTQENTALFEIIRDNL